MVGLCHHSLSDAVSFLCALSSMSEEFGPQYFIKMPKLSLLTQLMIMVGSVFYWPKILLDGIRIKSDRNIFTQNKKNMKGIINANSSKKIKLKELKDLSKKLNVTINDILISSCG